MKNCLYCDRPIEDDGWLYRLRVGGVKYGEERAVFTQEEDVDLFQDQTPVKWLCEECALRLGVHLENLETEVCRAPEGVSICGGGFEPVTSENSDTVLAIEWGHFQQSKGPGRVFVGEQHGHVHFLCACDAYRLPLWNFELPDTP